MLRRRLRLTCSSDEDDESIHVQEQEQQPGESENPNPNADRSGPIEISDDDFIDVSDNLSPPSPPHPPTATESAFNRSAQPHPVTSTSSFSAEGEGEGTGCPVGDFLGRLGLRLKAEWFNACLSALQSSVSGFASLNVEGKAKLCFERFLVSDMNYCGSGVLPPNVDSMHLLDLRGPYVLQVDEIVNISSPLRGRYQEAPPGIKRCLKLSMTDGFQRVFAMEYRPIQALKVFASAGLKVRVCNVHIRHGLLMLVPETVEVLGGSVEELEAARQRLVEEVNKPPRGKRTRTGVVPPLATRATLAAWPSNGFNAAGHSNSSTLQVETSLRANNQGATLGQPGTNTSQRTAEESTTPSTEAVEVLGVSVEELEAARQLLVEEVNRPPRGKRTRTGVVPPLATRATLAAWPSNGFNAAGNSNSSTLQDETSLRANNQGATLGQPGTNTSQRTTEESTTPTAENAAPNASSTVVMGFEEMHIDAVPFRRENTVPNRSPHIVSDVEVISMVGEAMHPLIQSGDLEIPFTYLSNLSVKYAAITKKSPSVLGKIKCFLTGVKGFQYKRRATYELRAYVDDGSLIAEIIIDHDVVQRGIGYSPVEVTAALSSSDKKIVSDMKETMKQFQMFLANFEGTMLVEMNKTSPLPIALEMNQGCPESDALLLLRRLKSTVSAQRRQHTRSDHIDVSP